MAAGRQTAPAELILGLQAGETTSSTINGEFPIKKLGNAPGHGECEEGTEKQKGLHAFYLWDDAGSPREPQMETQNWWHHYWAQPMGIQPIKTQRSRQIQYMSYEHGDDVMNTIQNQ